MSGRPRTFQEPEVIERASQLFWQQGFEHTGLTQLLEHIDMARQSLYNVFNDKRGLYLKCLAHVRNRELERLRERLSGSASPYESICDCLVAYATPVAGDPPGSMLVNAACEFGPGDKEVQAIVHEYWKRSAEEFEAALHRSIEQGEIPAKVDVPAVAWSLTQAIVSMMVLQRSGVEADRCRDVAYRAIEGIAVNAGI